MAGQMAKDQINGSAKLTLYFDRQVITFVVKEPGSQSMSNSEINSSSGSFDAQAKERELRNESEQWDTSEPEDARPDDIPVIDLHDYFTSGSETALNPVSYTHLTLPTIYSV